MKLQEIQKYIAEHGVVTIPEVQQAFSLTYSEARQAFRQLEEKNLVYMQDDLHYSWRKHKEKTLTTAEAEEAIMSKFNEFGIKLELVQTLVGATVTRYVFNLLSPKSKLNGIHRYADDIRARLNSSCPVRIVKQDFDSQVIVEVANSTRELVDLNSILHSDEFAKSNGKLDVVLGSDTARRNVIEDLAELPHLLVVGCTGSGKSIALTNLIISLAHKYSPDYVKFLLVDTKEIEFLPFADLPHLLTSNIVTNHEQSLEALDYLLDEMDKRYQLMKHSGTRNIVEYNAQAQEKLPYLVLIVDELADIMMISKTQFEVKLTRLVSMCRAAGIHVVLSTQRPDATIISGAVRANIPARIALKTVTSIESRLAINSQGAEALCGRGDMLFADGTNNTLQRIQSAYINRFDIRNAVQQLKEKYNSVVVDPLCKKALRYWLENNGGRASIASIQRKFGIGYNRAGHILDALQQLGYVQKRSADSTTKPLQVLVSLDDLDKLFPDFDD